MLPWAESMYESLRGHSVQKRRYEIGRLIERQMFLARLTKWLETEENQPELAKVYATIARRIQPWKDRQLVTFFRHRKSLIRHFFEKMACSIMSKI